MTIFVLSYLNIQNANSSKPTFQVLIKMLFNHLTILRAIETINYEYPELIKKLLSFVRQIVAAISRTVGFECLTLGSSGILGIQGIHGIHGIHDPEMSIHWKNLIITAFMPFITTVMCYFGFMLLSAIKNFKNPDMIIREANNSSMCSLIISLWIFYPDICTYVFKSFVCIDIEEEKRL